MDANTTNGETRTADTNRETDRLDPKTVDRPAAARAGIYTALATLLDEPDERLHERLANGDVDETVRGLLGGTGLSVDPPELTVDDDYETACARFNDLFTVGYAEYTDRTDGSLDSEGPRISLYESSYRPDAAWNDVNLDLARAYDYFGLEIDQGTRDNHDYLPYELEFAGYLARLEAAAGPDGTQADDVARARLDFHDRHLHVAAGGLAERAADTPGSGLYGEVADFLDRFVAADQRALAARFEGGDEV
ncbi:molecular chaperone TorD family protein [Haloferax denitrificans]|uniref:Chaperonin-like protein n=1 Tax=Haloferax denitrificans ATCC 35960 TaxID=662478 RepID=M0JJ10_9EURY|nr:molecular chaperone TorD family protein [Haloferax denitrificans]EMA07959.1 chaperonin-like protein [Haloferax denitrificans ATCC 35960]